MWTTAPWRRVSVLHLHMPRSTAPCEIPDYQGDSCGYQGLLLTVAYRLLWGNLFRNLWINDQLSPSARGELCFSTARDTRRCQCAGSPVREAQFYGLQRPVEIPVACGKCRLPCLSIFTHTGQRLLSGAGLAVCFIRKDWGTRPCRVAYLCERKRFQLHLNALKLRRNKRTRAELIVYVSASLHFPDFCVVCLVW